MNTKNPCFSLVLAANVVVTAVTRARTDDDLPCTEEMRYYAERKSEHHTSHQSRVTETKPQ
jgi:hypothetical protein